MTPAYKNTNAMFLIEKKFLLSTTSSPYEVSQSPLQLDVVVGPIHARDFAAVHGPWREGRIFEAPTLIVTQDDSFVPVLFLRE